MREHVPAGALVLVVVLLNVVVVLNVVAAVVGVLDVVAAVVVVLDVVAAVVVVACLLVACFSVVVTFFLVVGFLQVLLDPVVDSLPGGSRKRLGFGRGYMRAQTLGRGY
jgi:hypothetical protein